MESSYRLQRKRSNFEDEDERVSDSSQEENIASLSQNVGAALQVTAETDELPYADNNLAINNCEDLSTRKQVLGKGNEQRV